MSRFRVLGPIEAWTDEHRLVLGGPRQVALLAFLLLNANRAVSADAVIDAVWTAEGAESGKRRLQMGVMRLRRVLEPLDGQDGSRLRTVSGGYLLSIEPGELDARLFAEQVREGRRALEQGDPARASDLLAQALGLWRGPPLAEVAFEDFAQVEIRHLEELRLVALETRIDSDLQLGRHSDVIPELEGLLAQQPGRERIAGQLMTALYRSGRQADALEVYQRTRDHLAEQLGLEPGPALMAVQAQILEQAPALEQSFSGRVPSPRKSAPRNLPLPATPMIGRERELEEIGALLLTPIARLVTLTGPGGVGKTRLALTLLRTVEHEFADGVCLAELAGVGRAQDVGVTLLRALDAAPIRGESAARALSRYLADKDLLLLIDNFEHVLDAAGLVGELIAHCPGLTVLGTSREPLNLAAEHQYAIAPMPLPGRPCLATVDEVEAIAGTALFLAAVRRHEHSFGISEATAPVVAEVCTRLDGVPLALELAAARIGVLTLEELAMRLNDALSALASGPRDAPERQQTLQATIEWSYRLLTADDQRAFIRFAVFAGGATLAAAQAVTGASLETLERLHAKSLLRRQDQPAAGRLAMLDTVRQFALETSDDGSGLGETRRRHCNFYLDLVRHCIQGLFTPDAPKALETLDAELHNVRSAMRWSLAADPERALELVGLLGDYWFVRHDPDGLAWIDAALSAAGDRAPAKDRARAQLKRVHQLFVRRRHRDVVDAAQRALDLYRESGDDVGTANAYVALAMHQGHLGQVAEARSSAEAACVYAQAAGDNVLLGRALSSLANVLPSSERPAVVERAARLLAGARDYDRLATLYMDAAYSALLDDHPEQALHLLATALSAAERAARPGLKVFVLGNLGLAHLLGGNPAKARETFVEELKLCTGEEFFRIPADEALVGLAAVCVVESRLEKAAKLLGAGMALGYPGPNPADQSMLDRLQRDYFAAARSRLGAAAWNQLMSAGAELSYDQAIAHAISKSCDLDHGHPATADISRIFN